MLRYKNDRLDYGTQLISPQGYTLDRAVVTTFSLDLDTLLSIPVALHFSQTLDGKLIGERFQVLEAIKRASETVQVYCQAGRMKIPKNHNALYAYVEPMVTEILPGGPFESFHPKVWVLRYVAEELPVVYRVLVLSRNLTFDRSWDLVAAFEGKIANESDNRKNDDLIRLLSYLHGFAPINGYETLLSELQKVMFDPIDGFDGGPRFILSGVEGSKHPLKSMKAKRALIISAFLHKSTLERIRSATSGPCYLFGRNEELRDVPAETLERYKKVYQVSRLVVDGEQITSTGGNGSEVEIDEEDTNEIEEQNLHAKLFVLEEGNDTVTWHLGSANATEAGMTRNTEFGVELHGTGANIGIDRLLRELLGSDPQKPLGVFEQYIDTEPEHLNSETEAQTGLRKMEHAVLTAFEQAKGRITPTEEKDKYDLSIQIPHVPLLEEYKFRIRPFNTSAKRRSFEVGSEEMMFANVPEHELSAFVEVQILKRASVERQFLRKITILRMPETRLAKVFRRIVENEATFLRYLQFLLQEEINKPDLLGGTERSWASGGRQNLEMWAQDSGLYERLLVAASRNPRKLRDIEALLKQIQEDPDADQLIPDSFIEFWNYFASFIPQVESK